MSNIFRDRVLSGAVASATRVRLCLAVLVLLEGVIVLGGFSLGNHRIIGGDGNAYDTYAFNLLHHGTFSDATQSPFFSSVARTPGYPLFLALLHLIAPGSVLVVRVAQFGLLAATSMLVYSIGSSVGDERVGIISGLLCATYLPFIWLATYHLTESLSSFLATAAVWAMVRAADKRRERVSDYALLGLTMGVLTLVRPEFAIAVVPIAGGMLACGGRGGLRRRALRIGVLLTGFLVVLAPWSIRNILVTHRFVPLDAASGESLYASAQQYAGRISYTVSPAEYARLYGPAGAFARITAPVDRRVRRSRATSGVGLGTRLELANDDAIQAAARRVFKTLTVSQVLSNMPERIGYLWGTADYVPQGISVAGVGHRLGEVQWALILTLAAIGVFVGFRRLRGGLWVLLILPVYVTVEHLVFHSEGRYSLPPRGSVLILAAVGAANVARQLAPRRALRGDVLVEAPVPRDTHVLER